MGKKMRRKLKTFGIALAAGLAAWAPFAHGQDKSLRQEREEKHKQLILQVENKGRCIGYFDVNGNAAEVLELKSGLPKQDARAFVKGLTQYGQAFGQLAIGYGLLCEGDKQCIEAVVDANERGLTRGKREASTENVDAVKAAYVDCAKIFGIKTAMSPNAPSAPPVSMTNNNARDEADLRNKATDSARRAREAESEAQKAAEEANRVAANAKILSSRASSGELPDRTTLAMAKGGTYVGQVANGKREGLGMLTDPTAGRFSGQWREDRFVGLGTWAQEEKSFSGQWLGGKGTRLGVADFGNVKTIGKHEDWNLRLGVLEQEDASPKKTQSGHFLPGAVIDGLGVEETDAGERYEGEFLNGKRHGYALYRNPNGIHQATYWQDGKLISETSPVEPPASPSGDPSKSPAVGRKTGDSVIDNILHNK